MSPLVRCAQLALASFVLVAVSSCAGYVPGRKDYWDDRVRDMCARDGGVTVYEKVELTQAEYERLDGVQGTIPLPDEKWAGTRPYFSRSSTQEINAQGPRVTRYESVIVRRDDGKILGKFVSYSRVGGDLPTGLGHASNFSCRDVPGINLDAGRQVFSVRGGSR
jgi:hypothetical protein